MNVSKEVKELLRDKEKVLFVSRQSVNSSDNPKVIYVTDKRLIWFNSQPDGNSKYEYISYDNILSVQYDKKLLSTFILIKSKSNSKQFKFFVSNIKDASQIEAYIGSGIKGKLPKSKYI